MTEFDFKPKEPTPIVIAEKNCFKGALFGHISSGGGIIELGNGKGLKFIAVNEKFVTLQLLEYGIGCEIRTQHWQKTKAVKKVKKKTSVVKLQDDKEVTSVDLI